MTGMSCDDYFARQVQPRAVAPLMMWIWKQETYLGEDMSGTHEVLAYVIDIRMIAVLPER